MKKPDITVLGAGLTGLLIAHYLWKEGIRVRIIEARSRIGGRIYTIRPNDEPPIEMGATWMGKKHHHLLNLLNDLEIGISEQFIGQKAFYEPMSMSPPQLVELPQNDEPSYRIEGGTDRIIQELADSLNPDLILLNERALSIRSTDQNLEIQTNNGRYKADFVISTLPPKLLAESITFSPPLPTELNDVASKTHTWMGESIKVAMSFEEPFWRDSGSSGTLFSNVGPVTEMYDHCSRNRYALKGFMNNAYQSVSKKERKERVIEQLRRYYGRKVDRSISYHELVWQNEEFTFQPYETGVIPHQNNGHSIYQQFFMVDKLLIAGSETASEFPGYMDGAVESAKNAADRLQHLVS